MILPWTLAIWAHRTHARSCSCSCSYSNSCSYSFTYSYSYSSWQTGDYPTGFNTASATHCMHIFGFIVYMDKDLHRLAHAFGQSSIWVCTVWTLQVDSPQSTVHSQQSTALCKQPHFIMLPLNCGQLYLPYAIVHSAIMSSWFDSITLREYPAIWLNWLLASDSSQINVSD